MNILNANALADNDYYFEDHQFSPFPSFKKVMA
jgi:hypothetical protein